MKTLEQHAEIFKYSMILEPKPLDAAWRRRKRSKEATKCFYYMVIGAAFMLLVMFLTQLAEAQSGESVILPQYQGTRSTGVFQYGPFVNRMAVMPFYQDHPIEITQAVVQVSKAAPGFFYSCIYDRFKHLEIEAVIPTSPAVLVTDTEVPVLTNPSPAVLHAGQHFFASTADNGIAQGANYQFDNEAMNFLGWTDSAMTSGGHCPAQLEGVFAQYPQSTPWTVFRNGNEIPLR